MHILSLSDTRVLRIHSPSIKAHFQHIDCVITCGDLPYAYQEYVISMLDVPLFFVRGNHDLVEEHTSFGVRSQPRGGVNLHRKVVTYQGLLLAGVEGSLRYKPRGAFQYTQNQMWGHVFQLVPKLLRNKILYGRYLDVFVTHAPPWGIHDKLDMPHRGIKAFRWLVRVFQPAFHFHGHVHLYLPSEKRVTVFGKSRIINTFGYLETEIDVPVPTNPLVREWMK